MMASGGVSVPCTGPYFSKTFPYKDGLLYCENISVDNLAQEVEDSGVCPSSPLFVHSKTQIINNVNEYVQALDGCGVRYSLNYAMKANANPEVLRTLKARGCSVTLVSGMELKCAGELGFEPSKMVFNGNGKQRWEIEMALNAGCLLNIDSLFDLKQITGAVHRTKKSAKLLLRINPDIDPNVHQYVSTGLEGTKFGFGLDAIDEMLSAIQEQPSLELAGVHCHLGSTIKNISVFKRSAEILLEILTKLRRRGFVSASFLNIGGGLGIPYGKHASRTHPSRQDSVNFTCLLEKIQSILRSLEPSQSSQYQALNDVVKGYQEERVSRYELLSVVEELVNRNTSAVTMEIKSLLTDVGPDEAVPTPGDLISSICDLLAGQNITLIVEPGRSLIGNAAILLTNVLGCKRNGKKRFVVVDGAMTEVIRPCLYGAYHHIDLTDKTHAGEDSAHVYDIVGPVCESSDFLGKDRLLLAPRDGSRLAVFDVGAYCTSMASNYNLRLRPAEILVEGSSWRLIRRPDSYEDLMRPFQNVQHL